MAEQYLFVYGTLRHGSGVPQQRLLRRHAELLGDATINAILFDLGGYPGITLSSHQSDLVIGELYRLKQHQQNVLLDELDEYEECSAGFAEPHEYKREQVRVKLIHSNLTVYAWVYLYNRSPVPSQRIACGDYYDESLKH
jgi:gamma-glutamylcyclotransferase (GGCT)/AIG2-like uncharacterized protein YtfP